MKYILIIFLVINSVIFGMERRHNQTGNEDKNEENIKLSLAPKKLGIIFLTSVLAGMGLGIITCMGFKVKKNYYLPRIGTLDSLLTGTKSFVLENWKEILLGGLSGFAGTGLACTSSMIFERLQREAEEERCGMMGSGLAVTQSIISRKVRLKELEREEARLTEQPEEVRLKELEAKKREEARQKAEKEEERENLEVKREKCFQQAIMLHWFVERKKFSCQPCYKYFLNLSEDEIYKMSDFLTDYNGSLSEYQFWEILRYIYYLCNPNLVYYKHTMEDFRNNDLTWYNYLPKDDEFKKNWKRLMQTIAGKKIYRKKSYKLLDLYFINDAIFDKFFKNDQILYIFFFRKFLQENNYIIDTETFERYFMQEKNKINIENFEELLRIKKENIILTEYDLKNFEDILRLKR